MRSDPVASQAARPEAAEGQRRASFLAKVSGSLASSLDYQETLRNIARMAVPSFADWCAVDVVEADGSIHRVAVQHDDPGRVDFVRQIEAKYPPDHAQPRGVGEVVRTGHSEWMRDIPAALIEEAAVDAEHLELIRGLALRSYVIAPMPGKRETRGAITFVYAESGRVYEEDDVAFVEDLAARAAVALENAELVRDLVTTRAQLEEQSTELEMSNAELEQTLERLARSETLLSEAQSSAQLGSWEWDMLGGGITWTDEMYRLYGYEPQETTIDFERYMAGIHEEDRPAAQQSIQQALESNGTFMFEHRTIAADGGERVLHCRGRVVTDEGGRPIRMTGSAQDVTDRRRSEEAIQHAHRDLERANRAKSEFLAAMSHELRTPLNAIGGYLELITMGIHGPVTDAQLTALARIRTSQEHLLGLINDILQFAKVEAGRLEYRIVDLLIDDTVGSVVGMLETQARARGLECTQICEDDDLVVRADHDRVQQILINLIGNAIKFTDQGGSVSIECERVDDSAIVRVTDTGRGIAEEDLESIFDPFVQVRPGGEPSQGVGLGLAISRDLARAMGGELTVASRMGVGSTFTLRLPTS